MTPVDLAIIGIIASQWIAIWSLQAIVYPFYEYVILRMKPYWLSSKLVKWGKPFSCTVCGSHWLAFMATIAITMLVAPWSVAYLIFALPVMYFRAKYMLLNELMQ